MGQCSCVQSCRWEEVSALRQEVGGWAPAHPGTSLCLLLRRRPILASCFFFFLPLNRTVSDATVTPCSQLCPPKQKHAPRRPLLNPELQKQNENLAAQLASASRRSPPPPGLKKGRRSAADAVRFLSKREQGAKLAAFISVHPPEGRRSSWKSS